MSAPDVSPSIKPTEPSLPADKEASVADHHAHPLAQLSSGRKHFLLFIFSVASFIDVCQVSGAGVSVAEISADIGLATSQIIWIITAYSLCFASFLLFAGRLSDLFPAQIIFEAGFLLLGILTLVISFITTNKYGFLILRGLAGICGAMTIPSAFHLVVHMFPDPAEREKKLALLSMAGGIGNVLGLLIAAVCMLARWTWFFRVLAIVCVTFSIATFALLPFTKTAIDPTIARWKRLDIVGVALMAGCLICLTIALTQGPIDGWGSASFIAPFVICWILGPLFFVWEAYIPAHSAVLPASTWKITNITILSVATLAPLSFWFTSQLLYSTYWQEVFGWSPIHVAVAMLPQGIAALMVGASTNAFPTFFRRPRLAIAVSYTLMAVAQILQYFSDGGSGKNYWKYCFPAFIIGSGGAIAAYLTSAIAIITYCPPESGGVAGAWTQVVAQIGGAVALAVQSGLEQPILTEWKPNARAYWYELALFGVVGTAFLVFYKTPGTPEDEHEAARRRIRASNGDAGVYES
ncbi:hypothetical protein Q5752_003369 [Cryptotrichosporon argae]